jgi:hypothetical protein
MFDLENGISAETPSLPPATRLPTILQQNNETQIRLLKIIKSGELGSD